jgi:hypothetical protein
MPDMSNQGRLVMSCRTQAMGRPPANDNTVDRLTGRGMSADAMLVAGDGGAFFEPEPLQPGEVREYKGGGLHLLAHNPGDGQTIVVETISQPSVPPRLIDNDGDFDFSKV